jgi:hypothetical protein
MKLTDLNRALVLLVSLGLVGCEFSNQGFDSKSFSNSSLENRLNLDDLDDDNNDLPPPPPVETGISVANHRECSRQSPVEVVTPIYQVIPTGSGTVTMRSLPSVNWIVAGLTHREHQLSSRWLQFAQNSSVKRMGTFTKTTFDELGQPRYPDIEKSVFHLPIEDEELAAMRQATAELRDSQTSEFGGSIVLLIYTGTKVLTSSEFRQSTTSGPSGTSSVRLNDGEEDSHNFHLWTVMITGEEMCELIDDPEMRELCENECDTRNSPLVLDLSGDGVKATSLEDGINFDIDADGSQNKVAWLEGNGVTKNDDVFLVRDRNGNGIIDNGNELFGTSTILRDGNLPVNGFIALKELDSNRNGVIDEKDEDFQILQVWNDFNGNGLSEEYELSPLSDVAQSIDLDFVGLNQLDEHGNKIMAASTFLNLQGEERPIVDIFFLVEE